jgi:glycosyltransferase involved in cell wall biosynthesis
VKFDVFVKADIFLFPTYGEGLPVALLEAMAYGLPVVSRPVGGIKDFFEQGTMGFLAQSLNPEEFADHLENLINNPALRHEISVFNRQYAKLHFSASKVAGVFSRIYDEVLEETRT